MAFETREEFQRRIAYEDPTRVGEGFDNEDVSEQTEFGAGIDPPRFVPPQFGGTYRGTTPRYLVPYSDGFAGLPFYGDGW
jgi:hypothetical protein